MTAEAVALGVLVFMLAVTVDVFFVLWNLHSSAGRAVKAGVAAVFIQVFGVMGTLIMVDTPWVLTVNALGHGLGSFGAVVYATRNRGKS